jgi:sialic acid synthase SpsE
VRIGAFDLDERVLVVAEIGQNHEGDPSVAQRLVAEAAACGADAVKFQTYRTRDFVSAADAERFERMQRFELPPEAWPQLAEQARSLGLAFLSTPLDLASVELLEPLVDAYKIASADNSFYPLIDRVARSGKPMIVSAGLAELDEVVFVVERARAAGAGDVAVLHCVTAYPVADGEASLRAIEVLRDRLDCTVGYSDHTLGVDAVVLAVALGARIVEKHFTLAKDYSDFRDHRLAADPGELRELVARVRRAGELLGSAAKEIQPSELEARTALRRSVVAARDLPAGHRLDEADLTWLRPGGGLAPGEEGRVLGKTLRRALRSGERIELADVSG